VKEDQNAGLPLTYNAALANNSVNSWNAAASASFALPTEDSFLRNFSHPETALQSRPEPSTTLGQAAQANDLMETNFNTEDAHLLDFFRYGLAEWPDSTNIWPPINDFGAGSA
jgi:hypothetical protein